MGENQIFIAGQVASGKNSKRWVGHRLIRSKAGMKYIKDSTPQWESNKEKFLELIKNKAFPLHIKFTLIRKTKARFDYVNLLQLPQDLMCWHGWIPDDDANHLIPVIGEFVYDKENPGIIIEVL